MSQYRDTSSDVPDERNGADVFRLCNGFLKDMSLCRRWMDYRSAALMQTISTATDK